MANIKKLKENGQDIVPITHEQAVLDSNGVTLDSKLNAINNAISRLENNSTPSTPGTPSTPSLEGNIKILTIGNYTITYNETDDTLDFLYKGSTVEPEVPSTPEGEVVPLVWAVGNLDSSGAEIVQDSTLRTGFVTIEDNYDYSFYLDTSMEDPRGVRVYFYDSNKTFISRTDGDALGYTTGTDIPIDIPSTTAYMRFKSNVNGTTTLDNINTLFTLRKRKIEVNSYVTEGLSMYIDATRGSINDITGNHTIANHGVTHTSDNKYLNFVVSESDYIDCGFKPNLTQWSAEVYFYYLSQQDSGALLSWGASGNRTTISVWDNGFIIAVKDNTGHTIMPTAPTSLTHLVLTYNNGTIIAYVNGVKSQITTSAGVMTSQAGNLMIGTKYNASADFASIHLKSLRFYDGKVLTDEEALQNYKYETKNNYVTNGLSLYIDANDVTTQGSVRDITGNHTITNHGATLTSDNKYLNFVSTESDYLDTDFIPNLTQWSAEVYFYFTEMPTSSENVFTWGENPNQIRVAYSGSKKIFAIQCNSGTNYKITDNANILTPHHLILTMNNGTITSYYDGVKSIITSEGAVQTSPQTLTLKIGGNYSATTNFADMNLRMFRFYDGKVLTDEEVLQNYNYELNRDDNIIKPTWIYNKKPDSTTGQLVENVDNACTEFIAYDSSYNYTLAIDTVEFVRVFYYDSSQSYIKNDSIQNNFNGMITPPENTAYMRLKLARKTVEFADLDNHVIFRKTLK